MKKSQWALLALEAALLAVLAPSPALTPLAQGVTLYGACVALAAVAAVLLALAQAKREGVPGDGVPDSLPVGTLALVCIPAAFVGARALYCVFRADFFLVELGPIAMLNTRLGGFLLYGAALGAVLAAVCAARRRGADVWRTLDRLAAPGLLAVAICRLAECAADEGVGTWVESALWMRLPFAVANEYSEWQLAVFLWEAAAAVLLLVFVLRMRSAAPGERFLTALALYACCQVLFESLRQDSCLRIGFVRVSQVLSAVAVLAVTLVRALRRGDRRSACLGALGLALCAAVAGGIEWALDKTFVPNQALYAVMILDCAAMARIARGKTPGEGRFCAKA